ncbi:MAG: hypothetical protein H7841_02440 [Magnetospirillum sp. WYHS-4]
MTVPPPAPPAPPPRSSNQRRAGLLALAALLGAGALALLDDRPASGPEIPPMPTPVASAFAAPLPPPSAEDWESVDRQIAEILLTARRESQALAQKRISELAHALNERVSSAFLPWYLSFARRKLEELRAYNYYAVDWLHNLATGETRDSGTPALMATFEEQFSEQVMKPEDTRRRLQGIGRETAQEFGSRVARSLQLLQEERGISFAQWNRRLMDLPPLNFTGAAGQPIRMTLNALTAPDPVWHDLGAAIGAGLASRFERVPSIVDKARLVTPKGESIFAVGQHVGLYFGSYVVYWVGLLILVHLGIIPINLFGALIGWLAWEIFAWGSWIGLESLDFEQTRAELEPVILNHADAYFAQVRNLLADLGPSGPFKALLQLAP